MVGLVAEAVGVDAPVAGVLEPAAALDLAASGSRVVTSAVVVLGLVVLTIVCLGSLGSFCTGWLLAFVMACIAAAGGDASICVFWNPGRGGR